MNTIQNIVIIGGGAAGSLLALQLLRQTRRPLQVTLVDPAPEPARGLAYGAADPIHLLNVPAGRMGAWPDDPGHFLQWSRDHGHPGAQTSDFLPRTLYGDYLAAQWREALGQLPPGSTLVHVRDVAVDIQSEGGRHAVILQSGVSLPADRVALALGNPPGEYPLKKSLAAYKSPRYIHQPWQRAEALRSIPVFEDVLLVGEGLTAADMILLLDARGHQGRIFSISHRGLRLQPHDASTKTWSLQPPPPAPLTARSTLRWLRAEVRQAATLGVPWQSVVDAVRPLTQSIWQQWNPRERARFMRHLRPFWEIHRHRVAPAIRQRLDTLEAEGRVIHRAARVQDLREDTHGLDTSIRLRGGGTIERVFGHVINCTGPRADFAKFEHPLLINLLASGIVYHDPLALGLNATPDGRIVPFRGEPHHWLYTLGAPLKGVLWETGAIAEIRQQAATLAQTWTQNTIPS
jgi:uncharacterized NAD(P)/FAD-binding protein YdhS